MIHVTELLTEAEWDVDLALPMCVGCGAVDPSLIAPLHKEPDVEEIVAAYARV